MSRWKGVLDVLDETSAILIELGKATSEARSIADPIARNAAMQKIKTLAANALTSNQHAITALSRAMDLK